MKRFTRRFVQAVAVLGLLAGAAGQGRAGNLIVNGEFETGDFTGWTTTPATQGSAFYVASEAGIPSRPNQGPTPFYIPHSGTYVAVMGAFDVGFFDSISQTVATTPGQSYVIDLSRGSDRNGARITPKSS